MPAQPIDLDLTATMESGQVFGFTCRKDGSYAGILDGGRITLKMSDGALQPTGITVERAERYLDLRYDLSRVYAELWFDSIRGLRLIRQDPWEALACFILSSNNNIKRIQHIYANLDRHYTVRRKDDRLGFPSAQEIASSHERTLRELGLGYRAPFLSKTAQFLSTNPFYLKTIEEAPYDEAVRRVMAFPGIGPKVADCVLLYGFHRLEAFPVDVWVLRLMRKYYFKNRRVSEARIHAYGRKKWGAIAGYVQQYLFHAIRTGLI